MNQSKLRTVPLNLVASDRLPFQIGRSKTDAILRAACGKLSDPRRGLTEIGPYDLQRFVAKWPLTLLRSGARSDSGGDSLRSVLSLVIWRCGIPALLREVIACLVDDLLCALIGQVSSR